MKRTVWLWELFGFAVTSLGGTLLHFLYEWSGESRWAAIISGVNESTFEHMKLFFWPTFIFALAESLFFKEYPSFFSVKLKSVLLGLALIPLFFYGYNGVIGRSPDWVNISIFFIAAAMAYLYSLRGLSNPMTPHGSPRLALGVLSLLALLFTLFTFCPPHLALFRDPLTGGYGI